MIEWLKRLFGGQPKRTSWVWCPFCGYDLNGDARSFVSDDGEVVTYRCASCNAESRFLFNTPAPVWLRTPPTVGRAGEAAAAGDPQGASGPEAAPSKRRASASGRSSA